ncbi:hypothetical protein TNCV_786831 [Trichonephila clavipes]|nr:hypothetical protein TNCV_786831 [Trichonephila clavipes]
MEMRKRIYLDPQRGVPLFRQRLHNSGTYTYLHEQRPPVDSFGRVASTVTYNKFKKSICEQQQNVVYTNQLGAEAVRIRDFSYDQKPNEIHALMSQLQDDIDSFILQLDDAPPHWSANVPEYFDEHLSHRWIGRCMDYDMPLTQWSTRSPYLTP